MNYSNNDSSPLSPILGRCSPWPGIIFTGYAKSNNRKKDPIIEGVFEEHTCYLRTNSQFWQGNLELESLFRFIIVAGPFEKNHHKYALTIPFRELYQEEPKDTCILSSFETGIIKDAARGKRPEPKYTHESIHYDYLHLCNLIRNGIRI